jgi:hypothetical protein
MRQPARRIAQRPCGREAPAGDQRPLIHRQDRIRPGEHQRAAQQRVAHQRRQRGQRGGEVLFHHRAALRRQRAERHRVAARHRIPGDGALAAPIAPGDDWFGEQRRALGPEQRPQPGIGVQHGAAPDRHRFEPLELGLQDEARTRHAVVGSEPGLAARSNPAPFRTIVGGMILAENGFAMANTALPACCGAVS